MPKSEFSASDWIPELGVEHLVYETPWLDFYYDDITHPDGTPGKFAWVRKHGGGGGVMTIPVTPSGKFLVISVYRHPNKRHLWEFPAGIMEDGESPEEAGSRELIEETGVTPVRLELLGSHSPIGYSGSLIHAVLTEIPEVTLDDIILQTEEGIVDAKLFTQTELVDLIENQSIVSGPLTMCLARYWMWQKRQEAAQQEQT